jgi:hypothetical protein
MEMGLAQVWRKSLSIDKFARTRPSAVTYGVAAGLLAVGVQVFFNVKPPPAYGICMACHPRDMVNWLSNHLLGTRWELAPVSATLPLLTTVGLVIGASFAARRNREFRWLSLGKRARSFLLGLLVMNAALAVLGCPTRLLLLTAYGEILGLIGVIGLILGIVAGTLLLKNGIVD